MITMRVHRMDGHDESTLSLEPDGSISIDARNAADRQSLQNLLATKPNESSSAAWLHWVLYDQMTGLTGFERDDWRAQPHGFSRLLFEYLGKPWALAWMNGDRLAVQALDGKEAEWSVRQVLSRYKGDHWTDRELFNALPELFRGKVRCVPLEPHVIVQGPNLSGPGVRGGKGL